MDKLDGLSSAYKKKAIPYGVDKLSGARQIARYLNPIPDDSIGAAMIPIRIFFKGAGMAVPCRNTVLS